MTDCGDVRVRELLPDFMHDALGPGDMALVRLHLRGCEDCRSELAILQSCRQAMGAAPPLDMARLVRALPPPPASGARTLRLESAEGGRGRSAGGARAGAWRVAALALITIGGIGVAVGRGGHWPVLPTASPLAAHHGDVEGRGAADASRAAGAPAGGVEQTGAVGLPTLALAGRLDDLSDASLGELLADVERMEALPPEEPRPVILAGDTEIALDEETGGL